MCFPLFHFDGPLTHVFGESDCLAETCVDMNPHHYSCCRDFPTGIMHHFVKHANGLVLHFQKRRLDRNRIARMELALVLDVLFYDGVYLL